MAEPLQSPDPGRRPDADSEANKELERQQPGGGLNPKLLLIIGAVLAVAAVVTLLILLQSA